MCKCKWQTIKRKSSFANSVKENNSICNTDNAVYRHLKQWADLMCEVEVQGIVPVGTSLMML